MFLSTQPVPKTIEDLGHEVSEDTLLARLEHQRALQEEAIRDYKTDTLVIGAPKPSPAETSSEGSEEDSGDLEGSSYQSYDDDDDEFEDEAEQ